MLSGRHREAITAFRSRERRDRCTNCALPALGESYERMGDTERAIVSYERYLDTPYIWRFETDAPHLAWTMRRLEFLYARRGQAAEADAMRERLRALWQDADPEVKQQLPAT